jgi:NAD dependent epimerase/dehydratase
MSSNSKSVLVTGADGFIGSHLVEQLVQRGYRVKAFVCYNTQNSWGNIEHCSEEVKKEIEFTNGDVRDAYCIRNAVKGCDIVFHLAALISIPFSYQAPASFIETNVGGTLNILEACRDLGVEKLVHTSTSEVYGSAQTIPIAETHPLNAQSPYSASKIGADQLALSFYNSFSVPITIIRPFNTYGPRQSARAVIPATIIQIASGLKKIKLGSLHPTRDFNFVLDTVSGFIAAAQSAEADGEIINICSGFEISIADTVKLISEIIGEKIEIETDSERLRPDKSEVLRLCGDNSKALRILNWIPKYAGEKGVRAGLAETIDWFSRKNHRLQYKANVFNV